MSLPISGGEAGVGNSGKGRHLEKEASHRIIFGRELIFATKLQKAIRVTPRIHFVCLPHRCKHDGKSVTGCCSRRLVHFLKTPRPDPLLSDYCSRKM